MAAHRVAGAHAAAGALLVGGERGLTLFDPAAVPIDTTGPRVALTGLLVDEQPHALSRTPEGGLRPVTLPHHRNDLTLRFAALDLRAPARNRYRLRLRDGAAWTDLGADATARLFGLAPGTYDLQIAGANADGYWSRAPVTLPLRIRPPFWRAWWFYGLLGLGLAGLLGGAYQYRVRQLLRVERTRQRIADDLHDDIGSKISSVALRLDFAGRHPNLPDATRDQLGTLTHAARGVVDDLRDAVWIVDGAHDTLADLVGRIEQFARAVLAGHDHTLALPDAVPARTLDMSTRRHLYLLAKEALHNAVRHAEAARIDVRLATPPGRLVVTVADDGTGFDATGPSAGRGLKTMRRRAEAVGATLTVTSAPGHGTTVCLDAPV
jgi:signal transduction histidine kinase